MPVWFACLQTRKLRELNVFQQKHLQEKEPFVTQDSASRSRSPGQMAPFHQTCKGLVVLQPPAFPQESQLAVAEASLVEKHTCLARRPTVPHSPTDLIVTSDLCPLGQSTRSAESVSEYGSGAKGGGSSGREVWGR